MIYITMAKNRMNKKAGKKSSKPRRMGYRKPRSVADYAGVSETFEITGLTANVMYQRRDFTLNGSPRAANVATAYQHYRIKKITMRWKPQIDTFIGGGGFQVPNLFYMVDKSGSIPTNSSLAALKSMGASPKRFDDRTLTFSWRPSVLTDTASAPGVSSQTQYKISPWLSTNANALQPGIFTPSSVDHLGIFWFLEQGGAATGYSVEVTIEYQFKKPLNTTLQAATEAVIPAFTVHEQQPLRAAE